VSKAQAKRDARQAARELAAKQRRAEQRRKRLIGAAAAVGAVVLVIGILVGVKLSAPAKKNTNVGSAPAAASLVSSVTNVSPTVLDQAGKGAVDSPPQATSGQPVLKGADGKPVVFYMGAEYCPYCAAERWPMIVALSRFGTFQNLSTTSSSSTDTFPNTPTFTFHGASYTSQYIDFQPKEIQSEAGVALETLTSDQQKLVQQFDPPSPGTTGNPFPFIDFGNQAIASGASYNPQLLAGMTQQQVADALRNPNSDVAKAILGTANAFTNEICKLTNGQPGNVCSSAAATAYGPAGGQG
jgi:thiol-disulfide isomerase/thioredoxin